MRERAAMRENRALHLRAARLAAENFDLQIRLLARPTRRLTERQRQRQMALELPMHDALALDDVDEEEGEGEEGDDAGVEACDGDGARDSDVTLEHYFRDAIDAQPGGSETHGAEASGAGAGAGSSGAECCE